MHSRPPLAEDAAERFSPAFDMLAEMTRDAARAYVKSWAETGRLLERQRWHELAQLGPREALEAADARIRAALLVPLPEERRCYSGLVDQQRRFVRMRR